MENKNVMNNKVYGMIGVEAIHSNFNANFEGEPKNINGKIFATDVCLKHTIKTALNADGELILGLKRVKDDGIVYTLKDTYEYLFDTKLNKKTDEKEVLTNLLSCKDVKFFGTTFATDVNIGVTGAVQVGHGVNVLENTEIYMDDILSPYSSGEKKKMTTKGEEFRTDKAHYIYNFAINPREYEKYKDIEQEFTEDDYDMFKQYSLESVTRLNSRTKLGCENHFAMFIELKENECFTPNLRKYLNIIEEDDIVIYDLIELSNTLKDIEDKIDNIEIYYNPMSVKLDNIPSNSNIFNIVTRKVIE